MGWNTSISGIHRGISTDWKDRERAEMAEARAGNIYSRLKEDIDRSRQMYTERIDPRIKEDYFHQELVQRLAGGDPNLLGM